MAYSELLHQLKARGNWGHSGRPGMVGGSTSSSFSSSVGDVKVGDKVHYVTQLMRNRGLPGKTGVIKSRPDKDGFIEITSPYLDTNATIAIIHVNDITEKL